MAETLIMAVMGLPRPWQELTLLLRGVFVTNSLGIPAIRARFEKSNRNTPVP
jgi:hypothetical protein